MTLSLPEGVRRDAGQGALETVTVDRAGTRGEVYLLGATVTSWQPAGRDPVLWVSPTSNYQDGKAIRGGVPICFPWFGPKSGDPAAPQHGFLRTAAWSLDEARESPQGEAVTVTLSKRPDDRTRALWPHAFLVRYSVSFGDKLDLALSVENTGELPFSFEAALHTYFAVSDVRAVSVDGLEGAEYVDKTDGGARKREAAGPLVLTRETDRVYTGATGACEIVDPGLQRRISVQKDGSRTTVVWNPWAEKARSMKDVGDAWKTMLCVETVNAMGDAITLAPGTSHVTRARIVVNDLAV